MSKRKTDDYQFTLDDVVTRRKQEIRSIVKNDITIKAKNKTQKELIESIKDENTEIIITQGLAGCGKTFVSVVEAINLLRSDQNKYTRLYIFKSVKTIKGEEIGFLKGDEREKMAMPLLSFFNQFERILDKDIIQRLIDKDFIQLIPLGYIRGLSISDIAIVDETQNLSIETTKTVMTRFEKNSKLIILGDISQKDSKEHESNGLEFLVSNFKTVDNKIKVLEFTNEDQVRNPLITKILKIYEKNEK